MKIQLHDIENSIININQNSDCNYNNTPDYEVLSIVENDYIKKYYYNCNNEINDYLDKDSRNIGIIKGKLLKKYLKINKPLFLINNPQSYSDIFKYNYTYCIYNNYKEYIVKKYLFCDKINDKNIIDNNDYIIFKIQNDDDFETIYLYKYIYINKSIINKGYSIKYNIDKYNCICLYICNNKNIIDNTYSCCLYDSISYIKIINKINSILKGENK